MTEKLLTMPVVDLLKFGVAPEIVLRLTMVESELESRRMLETAREEELVLLKKKLKLRNAELLAQKRVYRSIEMESYFDRDFLNPLSVIEQFENKILLALYQNDPCRGKSSRRDLWSQFLEGKGFSTYETLASSLISCGNEVSEAEGRSSVDIISEDIVNMCKAFSMEWHDTVRDEDGDFVIILPVNTSDRQVRILALIVAKGLEWPGIKFRKADPGELPE